MAGIFRDYDPSDPFYKEGPQRYSPHWGRTMLSSDLTQYQNQPHQTQLSSTQLEERARLPLARPGSQLGGQRVCAEQPS
jgi:hypothetical protein